MKKFNVTGRCIPEEHYMVNIDDKLKAMKSLVDAGSYFVMNRARQYRSEERRVGKECRSRWSPYH